MSRVDVGSTLVESAGETMDEIVNAVTRVTDIMGEIASASDEQSRGIDQVGLALEEQASRLTQAVAVFHIQQEQQRARGAANVKSVSTTVQPRKAAVAETGDNWETF